MPDVTIAVAKGRGQSSALELLARAGVRVPADALASRRLSVDDETGGYRLLFVKPADVTVYVEHGVADCGIVGRDLLVESEADLLQPLDLRICPCRMVVASTDPESLANGFGMLRVATKFPRIAARHFGARGIPIEVIELAGSVELAPVLGLSDCIVDLVETGRTLRENGLGVVEVILESTARLAVNRASYQMKSAHVTRLIGALERAMEREVSA